MCGIFGFLQRSSELNGRFEGILQDLFVLSASRGQEAAGLFLTTGSGLDVLKGPVPAQKMVKSREYLRLVRGVTPAASGGSRIAVGHSRLVTNGSALFNENNQPVVSGHGVGVHNGIIVNDQELWKKFPHLSRKTALDSEVILALFDMFGQQTGSAVDALRATYREIQGTASVAVLFGDEPSLVLATNNGSLYVARDPAGGDLLFASEEAILSKVLSRHFCASARAGFVLSHLAAGQAIVASANGSAQSFSIGGNEDVPGAWRPVTSRDVRVLSVDDGPCSRQLIVTTEEKDLAAAQELERLFPHDASVGQALRRCSRCVLPETMPFISFDHEGVCNYCRGYQKLEFKGAEALRARTAACRDHKGHVDCLVGLSGGRDSLYTLHYVTRELGLRAVAYTYDWGMVTDLARRNISRICSRLGVEHVLVSADIRRKRRFIRQNVKAWLRRPHLGIVPLFMAGDKQYFYYLQKVRRELGAPLAVMGENMLERTDFKSGFAGIPPFRGDREHVYTIPLADKCRMASFYAGEFMANPAYINDSLIDTAWAAASYYMISKDYVNLFTYVPWEEKTVISTLLNEYDFELAKDTRSTWRIGDGTAAFYNYIYYRVAGFTENDTFRSNQIREGLISRDEALRKIQEENRPRYLSIAWYLHIIGLDPVAVLRRIGQIPTRYHRS